MSQAIKSAGAKRAPSRSAGMGLQDQLYLALAAITAATLIYALYAVFFVAPTERIMGIVQKIFYFHVPFAIAMGGLFVICGVASLAYLVRAHRWVDDVASTAAELAVLFGAIVLVTGPIWARKAWGTWWTWEPRLTLTMLNFFIYAGYLALRTYGGEPGFARRAAAMLGALGLPTYYFIKVAVEKWGGNHPKDVVYGKGEGLENTEIGTAFTICLVAVLLLMIQLFWTRLRTKRLEARVDAAVLEMGEYDLLEERL